MKAAPTKLPINEGMRLFQICRCVVRIAQSNRVVRTYVVTDAEGHFALHQRQGDEEHVGDDVIERESDKGGDASPHNEDFGVQLTRRGGEENGETDELEEEGQRASELGTK